MRKIAALITVFFTVCSLQAQISQLLFENFNSGFPSGWQRVNGDGLIPHSSVSYVNDAWVVIEAFDSTGVGDSVLVGTSYYDPSGTANDWLLLPPVTLEGSGNVIEWQVKSQDPSYPDGYQLLINTTAQVKDSFDISTPLFSTDAELANWTTRSVNLDSFANQTVYLAFRLKSSDKFLLLLDDIHVYADSTLSIEEPQDVKLITLFPNPASQSFTINYMFTKAARFDLMDMSGRNVLSGDLTNGNNTFNCNNLQRGLYMCRVLAPNGIQTLPVILR